MTNDALMVLQMIFQVVWRLFTGWHIPGTNITPGMFFLFLMSAFISLRVIKYFMDKPSSGGSSRKSGGD